MPDHIQPVFTAGPIPPDVARRVALMCAAQGRDVAERRMFLSQLGLEEARSE
jgi:hypothetical protein